MISENNGTNPLEKDNLISSSSGRQASSTPPMPPSTQKRPGSPGYAHHSGYATMFSSSSMSSQDRSLAEIIRLPFPDFNHKKEVIDPFSEDENRDQAFQEDVTGMILDALIETHAWSTARLKHESFAAAEKFEAGISDIIDIQKDQGTLTSSLYPSPPPSVSPSTAYNSINKPLFASYYIYADDFVCDAEQKRQKLNEFIGQIKNAIAALTNTMML